MRIASSAPSPRIVAIDGAPQPCRLDAHDRIELRIEFGVAAQHVDADRIGLDAVALALQHRLDDEAQKRAELRRAIEIVARRSCVRAEPGPRPGPADCWSLRPSFWESPDEPRSGSLIGQSCRGRNFGQGRACLCRHNTTSKPRGMRRKWLPGQPAMPSAPPAPCRHTGKLPRSPAATVAHAGDRAATKKEGSHAFAGH